MTRYQLARKQVEAKKNNQTGLLLFLLAIGGMYMAGDAILSHAGRLQSSMKIKLKSLVNKENVAKIVTNDGVQTVGEQLLQDERDR